MMMRIHPVMATAIAAAWHCTIVSYAGPAEKSVRDIRNGVRQLFLDDWIVAEANGVERRQGQAVKRPDNPIIKRDKPWDAARCDLYGSAVLDPPHNRVQLFYAANNVSTGHEDRLAYAESLDGGRTWTKPEFDLIPFGPAKRTNLVLLPPAQVMHGPCVFRDARETNPAKRYKLLTSSYPDTAYLGIPRIYEHRGNFLYAMDHPKVLPPGCRLPGMYVAYSPDGIHWPSPPIRISNMMSDTAQSVFRDSRIGKFVAYIRARTGNGRSVARMESNDFEHWDKPVVVLEGVPNRSIYSMGVTPYEGIYIGTPWIFNDRSPDVGEEPVIWPELAVSRDGIAWHRPFPGKPFVPCGPPGSGDSRQIRMSSSLVVMDDKILLLYGQSKRGHVVDMQVDIGMATLRRDGFAAMTAEDGEGTILTKPLRFDPGRLFVNAEVKPGGYVKAEIIAPDGKACVGYDLQNCVPVTGDSLRMPLAWKGKTARRVPGSQNCRFRFVLKRARLYSFWVDPE